MTVYIYALCDPIGGEIRYVGKTILRLRDRLTEHLRERFKERRCETHKSRWVASVLSRGDEPTIEVIERIENSDDTDWQEVERFWISYLRFLGCRLYNLDSGGTGGKVPCAATRAKLSALFKGYQKAQSIRPR